MATFIRVADAPPISTDHYAPREKHLRSAFNPIGKTSLTRRLFYLGLLALLLVCYFGLFGPRGEGKVTLLIYARYLLWPLSLAGLLLHTSRQGAGGIYRVTSILIPFALVGVFSSLLGISPVYSAKQIFFWLFGIAITVTIGLELDKKVLINGVFCFFLISIILSIGLAILTPHYGSVVDTRTAAGTAWNGAFVGKNQLGEAAGYLFVLSFMIGIRWWLRIIPVMLASVCLYFAHSESSVVATIIVLGLITAIIGLRRMGLSPALQATILITATLLAAAGLMFGLGPLLGALGRDPTLTGRTVIWDLYFHRAAYFWIWGAGPGSFTDVSAVTYDLLPALASIGHITSPHNMFIATFGETGVFGLLAMTLPLFYLGLVIPFKRAENPMSLPIAALTLTMLIEGLVETHEVFGPAPRIAIVMMMLARLHKSQQTETAQSTATEPIADGRRRSPPW